MNDSDYASFLTRKRLRSEPVGFDVADDLNPMLFEFQRDIVRWALRRGRAAIFADSSGTILTEYSADLEPGELWQDSRPFSYRAERDDVDAGWADVTVISGSGVVVYASVIDNVTNDATTVPMRR